jgi:hypothetical protein
MPKSLFYLGTAFCLFLALTGAATVAQVVDHNTVAFVAVHGSTVPAAARSGWAIVVALLASVAVTAILVRMATLLAARNLFGGFLALLAISAAVISLSLLLMLQARMVTLVRRQAALGGISEMHFVAVMVFAYFAAFTFLALRPYFRVQASRFLSALVVLPMPLFALILVQELFVSTPMGPLPAASPAAAVLFAVVSLIFFSIAVHCIRHRHMFLELTNLRELLDPRIDPAHAPRGLGDVVMS